MSLFKAFIRVVKSLRNEDDYEYFGYENIVTERMIEAEDKAGVKSFLLEKYPQFFQNNKIYERETKDQAQFFYVVIFPLYNHEVQLIEEGQWSCCQCGQVYENKYIDRPFRNERLYGDKLFCNSDFSECESNYKKELYKDIELPDDECYIKKDSPNYIYKITEKSTGKSYVGKTRNAPFFRWWNHLTYSSSPFGIYLRSTRLSEWSFEILEILPAGIPDSKVFEVESKYMVEFDSIKNGFNSLISKRQTEPPADENQLLITYDQNENTPVRSITEL